MRLSIVIPAYNEEAYLLATLQRVKEAGRQLLRARPSAQVQIIVVDNQSSDRTARIARRQGCRVVVETRHNIGQVRNTGATAAIGEVLVFVDADTLVPPDVFTLIADRMDDPRCLGGAVDVSYRPAKKIMHWYLAAWRLVARLGNMAQGATQFCRTSVFQELGGYDTSLFMGEDVEFYWKMKYLAKKRSGTVCFIDAVSVVPSTRRFDQWPAWKTFLLTNPLFIGLFRKTPRPWGGWYLARPK